MQVLRTGLAVTLILLVTAEARSSALDLVQTAKLIGSEVMAHDVFGRAVALDGDVAVVGVPNGGIMPGPGSAYVYRWDGSEWIEEQRLVAGEGGDEDAFGCAVEVRGDMAIVGASYADSEAGAVYTFRYDGVGWVQEQKLSASDGVPQDIFGTELDLDGDTLLVGAPHNSGTNNSGYVFRYDGSSWVEEQKLTAATGSNAGYAVALSGDVAILGDQTANGFAGRAIVFRFDGATWAQEAVLEATDGSSNDFFGASLAVDGDAAFVGAPNGSPQSSVYVFRYDGTSWIEAQKLIPSGGPESFGFSISLRDGVAAVGASAADDAVGAVYVYRTVGSSWIEAQKLSADDGEVFDQLGIAVALDDGRLLASAIGDENRRGSAYVFSGLTCFDGVVNAANDRVTNVLFVGGTSGGPERLVRIREGEPLVVMVQRPATGGSGRFVLHVNEGEPSFSSESVLPASVGRSCFPFLLSRGAAPIVVANNLGRTAQLGSSHYFGASTPDPDLATTTLWYPDFPLGTKLTLQAVIVDPGAESSKGASVTNAVVVDVVP